MSRWAALSTLLLLAPTGAGEEGPAPPRARVLVELFTSQG